MREAKIFIGDQLFGTVSNPVKGGWSSIKNKAQGNYMKIVGAPGKYLHFCGIKVWGMASEEKCNPKEEEPEPVVEPEPIPEPPKEGIITPANLKWT